MPEQSPIRSTLKHASIYFSAAFLQKAAGFILIPLYANYLGSEGYGIIGMIDVVVGFLTVSIGFGITGGMQRFYFTKQTEQERATLISTGIILMFFLVISVSLLSLVFSKYIANLVLGNNENGWFYIFLAILTFSADMTSTSASCFILIKQQSKIASVLSLSRFLIGFTLNIYFIAYLRMDILGFLYSNLITSVIFSIFTHFYVLKQVGIVFCRNDAKDILRYSLPLLPGSFAMLARNDADKVILRTFLGLSQLGAYVMLLKFTSLMTVLILVPFLSIWNVKQLEICETKEGPSIMANVFTLQLALLFFVGLILAVEVPLILKIMTPQEFWSPGFFAYLAVISNLFYSSFYNVSFGLVYAKLMKQVSMIQIAAAILSVILNYITIKCYGLVGALVSSCLVYLFQCVVAYYLADKHYHIPFDWNRIVWLTLIFTLLFFVIDSFSLTYLGISIDNISCKAFVTEIMSTMHLSFLLNSKITLHVIENMNVIIDALIKLVLCCSFIIAVFMLGIIKKENVSLPLNSFLFRFGIKFSK